MVEKAKKMVIGNILYNSENSEKTVDDMCTQSLHSGLIIPGPVMAEAVSKITNADVVAAAKKVAASKLTYVAVGNLHDVPYLDELH